MTQAIFVKATRLLQVITSQWVERNDQRGYRTYMVLAGTIGKVVRRAGEDNEDRPLLTVQWPVAWAGISYRESDAEPTVDVEVNVRADAVEIVGVDAVPDPRPRHLRRVDIGQDLSVRSLCAHPGCTAEHQRQDQP